MAGIHVVVARPDLGIVEATSSLPIGGFYLSSGESVLIFRSERQLPTEEMKIHDGLRQQAIQAVRGDPAQAAVAAAGTLRMTAYGTDGDGNRLMWDLGIPPWTV